MRFLLNMNVPRPLGRRLSAEGQACRHVGDIGMAQASDVAIMEEARVHREVIVTHDLDYGHLLAFSGEAAPFVIIFRVRNTHPDHLFVRIRKRWCYMKKDDTVYLRHILDAIEQIEEYLHGVTAEQFQQTHLLPDGVVRQLEIIGEASRNLSDEVRQQYPQVPWSRIVAMRDWIVHEYFDVDLDIVWEIA